jgi:hypothetical protein
MPARYQEAIEAVKSYDAGKCSLDFVTPVVSVCLATRQVQNRGRVSEVAFNGNAKAYARTIGLIDAIDGKPQPFSPTGLAGKTYSPLAHLSTAAEVEPCNKLMNTLFRAQLGGHDPGCVNRICKVIGELHDNVASHASGIGFSAAQSLNGWLYFAIADAGRGFLRNAKRVGAANSHAEAIEWAFVRGNTSARRQDDSWAQRWEPGALAVSDFGAPDDNHHQGLGLSLLEGLVVELGGSLWVLSGGAQRTMTSGTWAPCSESPVSWGGVAIELAFPIFKRSGQAAVQLSEPDDLAEELGL